VIAGCRLALLAALLTGGIGCSSGSHPGARPATASSAVPSTSASVPAVAAHPPSSGELVLPLDAYQLDEGQFEVMSEARAVLIGRCMAGLGFPFNRADAIAQVQWGTRISVEDEGEDGNLRRYSVTSPELASRYGYHLVSTVRGDDRKTPAAADLHGLGALTRQVSAALAGTDRQALAAKVAERVPAGGCLGAADRELGDSAASGTADLVSAASHSAFVASESAPPVLAAFSRWSACMLARGYHFADPNKAVASIDISSPQVPPSEIALASADVSCKQQSQVVTSWYAAERKLQLAAIARAPADFAAAKSELQRQLAHAAAVLAGSG
jgi:hypothetical protein